MVLVALVSLEVAPYDRPLSENKVRDAYFLGSEAARSARFLSGYVHTFHPAYPGGPCVERVEMRTPYAQIVVRSRQQTIGHSAQQAEEDYNKAIDTVQVRVQILYPLTQPSSCAAAAILRWRTAHE